MYLPPQFRSDDLRLALELTREHPLATMVSLDDEGQPFTTYLPVLVEPQGSSWLLRAHVARANPHWRHLQARSSVLVSFLGPNAYQSPSVYPDLQRVPTWNYVAVQARGEARLLQDPAAKEDLLKSLIHVHEPVYAAQWNDLPDDFKQKMLRGIVGLQIPVERLDIKFKLNQHRPEAHARMLARYASGTAQEQAVAQWMSRLGLGAQAAPATKE